MQTWKKKRTTKGRSKGRKIKWMMMATKMRDYFLLANVEEVRSATRIQARVVAV